MRFFCLNFLDHYTSQTYIPLQSGAKNSSGQKLTTVSAVQQQLFFALDGFNAVKQTEVGSKGEVYLQLQAPGVQPSFAVGEPEVPVYSRLLEIPQEAEVVVDVKSYDKEVIRLSDYSLFEVLRPAQAMQAKIPNAKVSFAKNEKSYAGKLYPKGPQTEVQYKGQMRDKRLALLTLNFVEYDPVENLLYVYNNVELDIYYKNADLAKTAAIKAKYSSPLFDGDASKALITDTPPTYVIVADRMFESTLASFITWKIQMGFDVIVSYTDEIGSTTTSIRNYLMGLYNSPAAGHSAPTFVLLVGDVAQIPAFTGAYPAYNDAYGGDGSSFPYYTDFHYGEYDNDYLPELFVGRFSAETTTDLSNQINKTITYEQYGMSDPSYLSKSLLVAGVDADNADLYANSVMYYLEQNYVNSSQGFSTIYSYYYNDAGISSVMASNNSAASNSVISKVSEGVGFGIYSAHCNYTGWADPNFAQSDIPALQNTGEYGLLVGNCCQSNVFYDDTFGEDIVRVADKGAVNYIGSAALTFWITDYWWAVGFVSPAERYPTYASTGFGLFDGLFHANGEATTQWNQTVAQMLHAGNLVLSGVNFGTENYSEYYWENYHTMGDPSVMPYLGTPSAMGIGAVDGVYSAGGTLNFTAVPYAYVALSQDGVLYGSARANAAGSVSLNYNAGLNTNSGADLVVTAQFYQPHITALSVDGSTPPSSSSIASSSSQAASSSSVGYSSVSNSPGFEMTAITANAALDPGVSTDFRIEFTNTASYDIYLATMDIETLNSDIAFSYTTASLNSSLSAGGSFSIANIFSMTLSASAAPGSAIPLQVTFNDNSGNSWVWSDVLYVTGTPSSSSVASSSSVVVSSSSAVVSSSSVSTADLAVIALDNNSPVIAGGTTSFALDMENTGVGTLNNIDLSLSSTHSEVSIGSGSMTFPSLSEGASLQMASLFSVSFGSGLIGGETVSFVLAVESDEGTWSFDFDYTAEEALSSSSAVPSSSSVVVSSSSTVVSSSSAYGELPLFSIAQGGTQSTCNARLSDGGGLLYDYTNNGAYNMHFVPAQSGQVLSMELLSFATEANFDVLTIDYGGSSPLMLSGELAAIAVEDHYVQSQASDGSLTFSFNTDATVVASGFEILLSCEDAVLSSSSSFGSSSSDVVVPYLTESPNAMSIPWVLNANELNIPMLSGAHGEILELNGAEISHFDLNEDL